MDLSTNKGFSRAGAILIVVAVTSAACVVYWSGLVEFRSENLVIVEVTSTKDGADLVLNVIIRNNGTADAKLEYIVVNGSVVSSEMLLLLPRIVPYDSQVEMKIQLDSSCAPNSRLAMRLHTASGKDFEQTITIPFPPSPPPSPPPTQFERLEIPTAYANKVNDWTGDPKVPHGWGSEGGWNITIVLKNSGSADATVDDIFINGKPFNGFSNIAVRYHATLRDDLSLTVNAGGTATIEVLVRAGEDQQITFSSGTTLDFKLHTAAGKEYPKLLDLT